VLNDIGPRLDASSDFVGKVMAETDRHVAPASVVATMTTRRPQLGTAVKPSSVVAKAKSVMKR
jgi:hypothetical protein